MDLVRKRKGLPVEEKLVQHAEKQVTFVRSLLNRLRASDCREQDLGGSEPNKLPVSLLRPCIPTSQ
eukprot:753522-Hanusia_phi.AAC.2